MWGKSWGAIFKNGDSDPLQFLHKLLQGIKSCNFYVCFQFYSNSHGNGKRIWGHYELTCKSNFLEIYLGQKMTNWVDFLRGVLTTRCMLHSMEIWEIICHSYFTWSQIWQFVRSQKLLFRPFQRLRILIFWFQKLKFKAYKMIKIASFDFT